MYSDKELKEMNKAEADERLETKEQWGRWNELRAEKHQEDLDKKKAEDVEGSLDALRSIRESAKEDQTTTVEIKGQEIKVLVDPDLEVWRRIQKVQNYANEKVENLSIEKVKELQEAGFYALGKATPDYSVGDWKEIFLEEPEEDNKAGLRTVAWLCNKVYSTLEEFREDEKKRSGR